MARVGMARPGLARRGTARHGEAWQGSARLGEARQGAARHGQARHGMARRGLARRGKAKKKTKKGDDRMKITEFIKDKDFSSAGSEAKPFPEGKTKINLNKVDVEEKIAELDPATKKMVCSSLNYELYNKTTKTETNKTKIRHRRRKAKRYTEQQCRKALELRAEGASGSTIARETGIRTHSINACILRIRKKADKLY